MTRGSTSRVRMFCLPAVRWVATLALAITVLAPAGCSQDRAPLPLRVAARTVFERPPDIAPEPSRIESTVPYRAKFGHAELYLPTWFSAGAGGYDVLIHFHGLAGIQERNLQRCPINAAIVSVNLGVGTASYASAFHDPRAFDRLLADAQGEVVKSGRAPGAQMRRIALSAWSAGFVSISKIMSDSANAERVDAVLLADGFFSSFTDPKRRIINMAPLEAFVEFAGAAAHRERLFAITHTAIPTGPYPSVTETVAKLLERTSATKTPSSAVGPRKMRETYAVDHGDFHVKGYAGLLAGDHIKQIHGMGETLWPYLKTRWEKADGVAQASRGKPPLP